MFKVLVQFIGIIWIWIVCSNFGIGQGLIIPNFEITHYDVKDGMGSGEKRQVVQDSFGNIWTGSSAGIDRFNGQSFKIYTGDLLDSTSFLDNEIKGMLVTPDGRVWMASNEGLFVFDQFNDKFVKKSNTIPLPHGTKQPCLTKLLFVEGKLYCGSYLGLYIYDINSNKWDYIDPVPDIEWKRFHFSKKAIRRMIQDKYNPDILYLAGFGFFFQYSILSNKIVKSYDYHDESGRSGIPKGIVQIDTSEFWISTYGNGLLKFNISTEELVYKFLPAGRNIEDMVFAVIYGFIELENGLFLMIFGDRSPIIFDPNSKEWTYFRPDEMHEHYSSILRDRDGNIWMAGFNGLTKLSMPIYNKYPLPIRADFKILSTRLSKDKKNIFIISQEPRISLHSINDKLEIGSAEWETSTYDRFYDKFSDILYYRKNGLLEGCDPQQKKVTKYIKLEKGNEFESLKFYKKNIFALYENELILYDKKGKTLKKLDVSIFSSRKRITTSCGNSINIMNDSILFLYNCSHFIRVNYLKEDIKTITLPNDRIFIKHVFEANKSIWIVNKNFSLIKLEWNVQNSKYNVKYIFKKDKITNVGVSYLDSLGQLWICNYNGIKAVDTKTDNVVYNLDGRYGFKYLDAFINETKDFIWVSTPQNLLRISKHIKSSKIGKIALNSVKINGEQTIVDHTLELSYLQNNFVVDWNVPYLGKYDALNSYYKIENYNDEWRYIGDQSIAFLSNLPSGKYEFKVKANAFNKVKSKTLFKFEISPPWWKTWWFYMICGILTIVSLYFVYKRRVATLTKSANLDKKMAQLEIKALRAQLNPHFIFNCLNSIKALIQKDKKQMAIEYLIVFAVMIRNVLDLSDKNSIPLEDELDFSKEYIRMEKLRFGDKFHYSIDIDDTIDTSFIEVPPMILQPHIENALWHGLMPLENRKGILSIIVKDYKDYILIVIDDNGIGRAESTKLNDKNRSYKHNSRGTSLSVDRIKLGTLVREQSIQIDIIDKENDNGTTIEIKLLK